MLLNTGHEIFQHTSRTWKVKSPNGRVWHTAFESEEFAKGAVEKMERIMSQFKHSPVFLYRLKDEEQRSCEIVRQLAISWATAGLSVCCEAEGSSAPAHFDRQGVALPDSAVCVREKAWRDYTSARDGMNYNISDEMYATMKKTCLTRPVNEKILTDHN